MPGGLGFSGAASSALRALSAFHTAPRRAARRAFTAARPECLVSGSSLVHPEVKFSEYSGIDVQAGSTLTMDGNKAVTVYNLSNSGDIELGDTPLTVKNIL